MNIKIHIGDFYVFVSVYICVPTKGILNMLNICSFILPYLCCMISIMNTYFDWKRKMLRNTNLICLCFVLSFPWTFSSLPALKLEATKDAEKPQGLIRNMAPFILTTQTSNRSSLNNEILTLKEHKELR